MNIIKKSIYSLVLNSPSFIKVLYFKKIKGYKIGKNTLLGKRAWINGASVEIGDNVSIGNFSTLNSNKIKIGSNTKIDNNSRVVASKSIQVGKGCYIGSLVTIGGGQSRHSELEMGDRVKIFENSYINTTRKVYLGDDVGIGGHTLIFTHGTWQNTYKGYPYKFGDVTIKKGAWLPWRVFVMPGVTIGENATIGSAATIVKDISNGYFAAGSPAKELKPDTEYVKPENNIKVLKEILHEQSLDYNFQHGTSYQVDLEKLEIRNNDKVLVKYYTSYENLNADLCLIDTEKTIQSSNNIINLKNNLASIKQRNTFTENFIDFLSNYGIRIIEE